MSERTKRLSSLMHELAATFIRDEANTSPLITVTGAEVAPDLHHATIFVSVFPETQEPQALIFLKRKAGDFRTFVKSRARLKDIPHFEFSLDYAEKRRQMVEDMSETDASGT